MPAVKSSSARQKNAPAATRKLAKYREKRNFRRTPEPQGGQPQTTGPLRFVIQKHAASRLHYDFRLELDGVLKSWAVPKGPSLDPRARALAVHVEDHPIDYADFEGIIPAGEYGGGTVMVWDHGTWDPEGDPRRDYNRGRLRFTLHGEKLAGSWTLVRMSGKAGEDGKNWLLIKRSDDAARAAKDYDVLVAQDRSVVSHRTLDEIAGAKDRIWTSRGEPAAAAQNGTPNGGQPASSRKASKPNRSTKANKSSRRRKGLADVWVKRLGKLTGVRTAKKLVQPAPMLATLSSEAPAGDQWVHEVKFDGYRILAVIESGRARLRTRHHNDWTQRFQPIADALLEAGCDDIVLDGEVVSLDERGLSNFQQLQNSMQRGIRDRLVYYVFDMPYAAGHDLAGVPLLERKQALRDLIAERFPDPSGPIRFSDHIQGDGPVVLEQTCRLHAEGIVSKRAGSGYESARSRNWLKIKCLQRQELVIGGFTKPTGARQGFGSLLLGYYDGESLVYCGRVGTGFTSESLRSLTAALKERTTRECPFDSPPPASQRRTATWVRPELVAEVEFSEWTNDNRLRHPSFQGLREDKSPREIVREVAADASTPKHTRAVKASAVARRSANAAASARSSGAKPAPSGNGAVNVAGIVITNSERELYPQQGITKRELAEYYAAVAPWILPHVADRPLTLVRCPQGRHKTCFYQKHFRDAMPDALRAVEVKEKNGTGTYVSLRDREGLIALVQIGVLELHPWGARNDRLEKPDRVIWDLDPGEASQWTDVLDGARRIRDYLEQLELRSFVRTSGGKGLHVVLPIERRSSWPEVKAFARGLAELLVQAHPDKYVATASKARRRGKVFIDYLRNDYGATAIASYSSRARSGAPVAMPLAWDELKKSLRADQFHVRSALKRLEQQPDPWADFFRCKQSLSRALKLPQ